MNILIYSDLHIEYAEFNPPKTNVDVVVLAGDIGEGFRGLHWAAKHFTDIPVIYVPGNHEFYYHDLTILDELKAQSPHNIHVLHNNIALINGVRFVGTILWTDFELDGSDQLYASMDAARSNMSDFRAIKYDGWPFMPEASRLMHHQSRLWLKRILNTSFEGDTVVVTHHAPSPRSIHPRYQGNLLNPAFASDLEPLMDEEKVQLWVHGHTRDAYDYTVNGTRVICNPRAYSVIEKDNALVKNKIFKLTPQHHHFTMS